MIVVTLEGAALLWQWMLRILNPTYPYLHLIGSTHTVIHTDTESTLAAVEVGAGLGYAPVSLTNPTADWTLASIGSGVQATYLPVSWTFTGSVSVYGWWLSDGGDAVSLYGETFSGPFVFPSTGGTFTLILSPWLASYPDVADIPCISP